VTTYKLRIVNRKIVYEPSGRAVALRCYLEDTAARPFLVSGSLDLFDVRIPQSILPGSSYTSFIQSLITSVISDKYTKTVQSYGTHANTDISVSATDGIWPGMGITGPGVQAGSTVISVLVNNKVRMSATLVRQFTGTLTNESISLTGTLVSASTDITAVTTSGLSAGMSISGTGVASGAVISAILTATSLRMSQTAVSSGAGVSLTFSPHPSSSTITSISPALISDSFRNMTIAATNIPDNNTTILDGLTSSSLKMSANATTSGSQTLTISGTTGFVFGTSDWTLDLTEVTTLVNLINFGVL